MKSSRGPISAPSIALPIALLVVVTGVLSGCASGVRQVDGGYLARAHSHNDYERARPLMDAVERGFASVEVDIHLVDGNLLVAHDPEDVRLSATLEDMYLNPLRELARRNGGWIYGSGGPTLQLLVDVKTDAEATYMALHAALAEYDDVFTRWTDGQPTVGAVTAVVSGNRALSLIAREPVRYVAIDGRISDSGRLGMSPHVMPIVSLDWEELQAPDSSRRLEAARSVVETVHREGRKVRFWGTPDREELWRELLALGVDYIGTDDPQRLDRLLRDTTEGAALDDANAR